MKVTKLPTLHLHGYNLQFSRNISTDYLACASSVNYGLAGSGELLIFHDSHGEYVLFNKCFWSDAMFDLSWNPGSNDLIATCSGDGKVQIWSLKRQEGPCHVFTGHFKEASSVDWIWSAGNQMLLSSSWDGTVRVWCTDTGNQLCIFLGHNSLVYEAKWSPHIHGILASVGGDKSIRIWDIRAPELLPQEIIAHTSDVLTIDWSTTEEHIIATGGVDCLVKGWDLRQPSAPIFQVVGHEAAVRRVKFSPFHRNVLASVSYDFSTRFWDWMSADVTHVCDQHTEFVYGLDFSPKVPNKVADCSWDSSIHVYEDVNFNIGC